MDVWFVVLVDLAMVFYGLGTLSHVAGRRRTARVLLVSGLIANLGALFLRGWAGGVWYWGLAADETFLVPAFLALIVLANERGTGRWILLADACLVLLGAKAPAVPTIKVLTPWCTLFFLTEALSGAFFLAAAEAALAALAGRESEYRSLLLWGFAAFTICQIVGAVWAWLGWSYPFSWSNRHLASAAAWCLAAAVLHGPVARVSGRSQAWAAVLAAVPMGYLVFWHAVTETAMRWLGGAA